MPPRLSASPDIHDHLCRHEIGSILTIGVRGAIALSSIKKLDNSSDRSRECAESLWQCPIGLLSRIAFPAQIR
jgi:hypothetical protein